MEWELKRAISGIGKRRSAWLPLLYRRDMIGRHKKSPGSRLQLVKSQVDAPKLLQYHNLRSHLQVRMS